MTFRVVVDGDALTGPAVSVPDGTPSPETLARAVVDDGRVASVRVDCPRPGRLYGFVSPLRPSIAFDRRGALAELARSEGYGSPQAAEIERLREEIAESDTTDASLADARRRAAEAGEAEARLRESVAAARGRLQTLRELDRPDGEAAAPLREEIARLSEAETERMAAEERLRRLEREARRERDDRDRRFELEDRLANRRRDARAWLAGRVYERFAAATARLAAETGVDADAGTDPGDYEGDALTAAAAVARAGDVAAPVVVATDRFGDAERAARLLDSPVIRHP